MISVLKDRLINAFKSPMKGITKSLFVIVTSIATVYLDNILACEAITKYINEARQFWKKGATLW